MELLSKIKDMVKGKKLATMTGYREFVRAVATGQKIDTAKAADAIDQAGKTVEEFEADTEALVKRIELRAVADKAIDAAKKLAAAQAKIEQLEKRLEQVVSEIRTEAAPHHDAVRKAEADAAAARNAEDELRRSYPSDGPARVALADAQRRGHAADAKRRELAEMIQRAESTIRLATASPNHYADDVVPNAEKRLAGYREELAAADAEKRAAVAAMEAATAAMVQP